MPWKLKYLDISQACDHKWAPNGLEGVLQNCHSLEKLSAGQMRLDSFGIEKICQNSETLRILSLKVCNIRSELIKKLFTECSQLIEVNLNKGIGGFFGNEMLLEPHLFALVDNLTPNILKLNLSSQKCLGDKHVKTLVQKCNKITELELSFTQITNKSMESIVKNLSSLEKLDVSYTKIDYPTLLQLKSIPTLKVLHCFGRQKKKDGEKIKNLKLQLPHISINKEYLDIASSSKEANGEVDQDWFWEVRSKQQDLFPQAP